MDLVSASNLLAFSIQIACVAVVAEIVMAVLRIGVPGLRYAFWRVTLAVCLTLPLLQTPQAPPVDVRVATAVEVNAGSAAPSPGSAEWHTDWTGVLIIAVVVGIVARLTWVAIGFARLRRLRSAGDPLPPDEGREVQARLGTRALIRYAAAVTQPVTFGVLSPIVLLPQSLRSHSAATRQAVLTHELLHVCRRDWCWVLIEEIVRALFWFHPAVWWLVSRVQLAREELVDATAVALTGQRTEYVRALLVFADDVPLAPAPAFARRRHLFRRIVLLSTEDVMSARRTLVSAALLGVVLTAGGWSAIAAFPMQSSGDVFRGQPGPVEQVAKPVSTSNPIPRRLHAEEPVFPVEAQGIRTSVTVTLRTIVNTSGAVAEVRLARLSFQLDDMTGSLTGGPNTLGDFEKFMERASVKRPGAERVPAGNLRSMLESFIASAATAVQRSQYEPPSDGPIAFNTIVHFLTGQPTTMRTVATIEVSADGAIRVGGTIKPPNKIYDVKPVYPQEAQAARVQGVVVAEVRVEPDGRVGAVQVVRSIPLLDEAAVDAIRQWEFTPTRLNGAPVPVVMTVTVQFTLAQ